VAHLPDNLNIDLKYAPCHWESGFLFGVNGHVLGVIGESEPAQHNRAWGLTAFQISSHSISFLFVCDLHTKCKSSPINLMPCTVSLQSILMLRQPASYANQGLGIPNPYCHGVSFWSHPHAPAPLVNESADEDINHLTLYQQTLW
jgi:hypothetical protein